MFYHLLVPLSHYWIGFNVFRYITFRATFAAVTAFVISLIFGPGLIRWLESRKFGEKIRSGDDYRDLADRHRHKAGTPTMGGIIILLALLIPTLLWERWDNPFTWMAFGAAAWMGAVGFADDWMKLRGRGKGRGMSGRIKLGGQVLLALAICFFLYSDPETRDWAEQLRIPFYKHPVVLSMGLVWILFTIMVIAGSSNAVNLTDGLDGLAIGCIGIAAFASAVMAYLTGHREIA
nr:phospho-N-acetylmuramoyl-pentapeptide-transferase [bacterium]